MTTKEFYEALGVLENEELETKRQELIAGIDKVNSARAAKRAEKNAEENEPLKVAVLDVLNGTMTASEIKDAVVANGGTISTPKVTAIAKLLVGEGKVKVEKKVGDTKNYYTKA